MAAPIRIPRQYEDGLAKILGLSDESVQELLAALQTAPLTVDDALLSSEVSTRISTIPQSNVAEIVSALISLHSLSYVRGYSVTEIAEGVSRGMDETRFGELGLTSEDRERLQRRLMELLSLDSLRLIAKAGYLLFEQEHSLRQTRILTDIRPVFEPDDPGGPPNGAVIVHTLKITYFGDNELKEFFVALDTGDISVLLEQLERAKSKAESLKSVLAAAGVPYIGAE